jgi:cytochrome c oxidase subunit 2
MATTQSSVMVGNWQLYLVVGSVVAASVWGLILFAVVRYRRRGDAEPVQFANNYPLEIAWTLVPLGLVCWLFVYTYSAEASVETVAGTPAVSVHVNAYRWGWSFAYDGGPTVGGAAHGPILDSAKAPPPELVLPANETARLTLTSSDVNHSFWVPAFWFKRDAIPGQVTTFDVKPDQLGTFEGRCAAFCGLNHALMTFDVKVVSPHCSVGSRRPITSASASSIS